MAPSPPSGGPIYDGIGVGYTQVRRTEPRIASRIHAALGDAERVLNVGAGSGSYEPPGGGVVAVEPSTAMIGQRPPGAAPVVRGVAQSLPFAAGTFDAAMASLTIHHWPDPLAGLAELRRVTTGAVVVFTFDNAVHERQWLVADYLPAIAELDADHLPSDRIAEALGGGSVEVVPVPHDCVDGFMHAWWRRPAAYLDPSVQAGNSGMARLDPDVVSAAMDRLAADLESGAWADAHRDLLDLDELDAGYRLVVSPPRG